MTLHAFTPHEIPSRMVVLKRKNHLLQQFPQSL